MHRLRHSPTNTFKHTHTFSEMFSDAEKHTYSCTNLQELHRYTAYLKESFEYLLSHAFIVIHASIQHVWAPSRCWGYSSEQSRKKISAPMGLITMGTNNIYVLHESTFEDQRNEEKPSKG